MSSYARIGLLQVLNIVSFVAVVIANGLADFLPINGQTTGAIAGQYPNLFTPASISFSIWLIIYSLLFMFCIYQGSTLFETEKRRIDKKEKVADRIGFLFIISCALNIAWIFAWHYHQVLLSVLLMLALLWVLAKIFIRVHDAGFYNGKAKWFVYVPFSVYLGWISVATISNVTAWLVSIQWNGFHLAPWIWASVMIAAATILGTLVLLRRNNIYFPLVIIWALIGIIVRQYALFGSINNISLTAISGSVLLLILIAWNKKHTIRGLASPSQRRTL